MPSITDLRRMYPDTTATLKDEDIVNEIARANNWDLNYAAARLGYETPKSDLGKEFYAGGNRYLAGMGHIGAAVGVPGAQEYAAEKEARADLLQGLSKAPHSWDEVKFGDPDKGVMNYVGQAFAGSAPYMAEAVGYAGADALTGGALTPAILARYGAVAPRVLGGGALREGASMAARREALDAGQGFARSAMIPAVTYPSSLGDVLSNQYEQSGGYDLASAAPLAAGYAGMNFGGIEGAIAGRNINNLSRGLTRSRIANAALGGAEFGAKEAGQEVGQEVFNQYARNAVDPTYDPFGDKAMEAYKESAIAAGFLGGLPGSIHGAMYKKAAPIIPGAETDLLGGNGYPNQPGTAGAALTPLGPNPNPGQGQLAFPVEPEANVGLRGLRNPYDTAGFVTGFNNGNIATMGDPQADVFGTQLNPNAGLESIQVAPAVTPAPQPVVTPMGQARQAFIDNGGTPRAWATFVSKNSLVDANEQQLGEAILAKANDPKTTNSAPWIATYEAFNPQGNANGNQENVAGRQEGTGQAGQPQGTVAPREVGIPQGTPQGGGVQQGRVGQAQGLLNGTETQEAVPAATGQQAPAPAPAPAPAQVTRRAPQSIANDLEALGENVKVGGNQEQKLKARAKKSNALRLANELRVNPNDALIDEAEAFLTTTSKKPAAPSITKDVRTLTGRDKQIVYDRMGWDEEGNEVNEPQTVADVAKKHGLTAARVTQILRSYGLDNDAVSRASASSAGVADATSNELVTTGQVTPIASAGGSQGSGAGRAGNTKSTKKEDLKAMSDEELQDALLQKADEYKTAGKPREEIQKLLTRDPLQQELLRRFHTQEQQDENYSDETEDEINGDLSFSSRWFGGKKTESENTNSKTREVKASTNTARLAALLGPQLYGDMTKMATVSIKELFQNSFDAIKTLISKGQAESPEIRISTDAIDRTITISDNGSGMTPEIITKAFLTLAGTNKETDRSSGGFGIAKMQFLFGNEELSLRTVRDGVETTMVTNGKELMSSMEEGQSGIKLESRETDAPNGTVITIKVPDAYTDPSTGEQKGIDFPGSYNVPVELTKSPLFEKIKVVYNGDTLNIGQEFPVQDFTTFANVKFEWGNARIVVSKEEPTDTWNPNTNILSNGLYQFSTTIKANPMEMWGPGIKKTIYINVEPTVRPEDPGYPFDLARQGFSKMVQKDFAQIFNYISMLYRGNEAAEVAMGFGNIEYLDENGNSSGSQKLAPDVSQMEGNVALINQGDDVEVVDGRLIVNGKEIPTLTKEDLEKSRIDLSKFKIDQATVDTTKAILHDNLLVDRNDSEDKYQLGKLVKLTKTLEDKKKQLRQTRDGLRKKWEASNNDADFEEYNAADTDYWSAVEAANDNNKAIDELREKIKDTETDLAPIGQVGREAFGKRFDKFVADLGHVFIELRDNLAGLARNGHIGETYTTLDTLGIGVSFDNEYHGVHVRVPFQAMFINPAVLPDGSVRKQTIHLYNTMVHEAAHHEASGHDARFWAEDDKLSIALEETGDDAYFKEKIGDILTRDNDILEYLRGKANESTTKNMGSKLEEPSYQRVDAPLAGESRQDVQGQGRYASPAGDVQRSGQAGQSSGRTGSGAEGTRASQQGSDSQRVRDAGTQRGTVESTTVDRIKNTLKPLFFTNKRLTDKVTIVNTWDELPPEATRYSQLDGNTQAFVLPNGRAYMIADRIDAGDELAVFLHEVGVHLGMEKMLGGKANFVRLAQQIVNWFDKNDGSPESRLARIAIARVDSAAKTTPNFTDADYMHEVVAYFTEEAVRAGYTPTAVGQVKNGINAWLKSLWDAAKAALRKFGLDNLESLKVQDVVDLAMAAAHRNMMGRSTENEVGRAVRFSKRADPSTPGGFFNRLGSTIDELIANPVGTLSQLKLGWMTLEQIADRIKSTAVKQYVGVMTKMQQYSKDLIYQAAKIDQDWGKLNEAVQRNLSQVMRDATRAGFDPEADEAVDNAQEALRQRFNTLPDSAQQVYRRVRDHYQKLFDERKAIMLKAAQSGALPERNRAEVEAMFKKVKGPYFPLMRIGKWYAVGMSKEMAALQAQVDDGTISPEDEKRYNTMRKDKAHYITSSFESRGQAKAFAKNMKGQYTETYFNAAKEMLDGAIKSVPDLALMQEYVGAGLPEGAKADVKSMLAQMYFDLMPENSPLKRLMKREGIYGEEEDMRKVFATSSISMAHHVSRLKYSTDLSEALQSVRKGTKRDENMTHVYNELVQRANLATQSDESSVVDLMVQGSYFAHLGLSPAFVLTNMTQVPMITAPWLGARYGLGKVTGALSAAYADAAKIIGGTITNDGWRAEYDWNRLFKEGSNEDKLLKELLDRNLLDITMEHDLGAVGRATSTKTGRKINDAVRWSSMPVRASEAMNRLVTGLAAYRLEMSKSGNHERATEVAAKAISETQLNYSALNAPRYMQSVMGSKALAKLMFQFRKYQQGMVYLIVKSGYDAVKGGTKQEKAEAAKTLFGLLTTTGLMAGATGLPFAGSAFWLASVIGGMFGDDDEPFDAELTFRNYLADMLGDDAARAVAKGLPTLMGTDISGNVGQGNIGMPFPFMRDGKKPSENLSNMLVASAGAPFETMMTTADGLGELLQGDFAKGTEHVLPLKAAKNIVKAYRYSADGMTDSKGNIILPPENFSPWDLAIRSAGFTNVKESDYYAANNAMQKAKQAATDVRAGLLREYANARLAGEDVSDFKERIADFNTRHPEKGIRIDQSSLLKAVTARRNLAKDRTETGLRRDKYMKPYLDEARFADGE